MSTSNFAPHKTVKLDAVNAVLRRIGLLVVPSLDTGGTTVHAQVERTIDDAELRIQKIGWHWNTRHVTLEPDNGIISTKEVPAQRGPLLEIDTAGISAALGIEVGLDFSSPTGEGRLYKLSDGDFQFSGSIEAVVIERLPFEQIPGLFSSWIVAEAAFDMHRRHGGDRMRDEALIVERQQARVNAMRQEIRLADVNVLDSAHHRAILGRRRLPKWSVYA